MAQKSIYSPGGSGMTTGGLDGYLGPQAKDHSNLPEHMSEDAVKSGEDAGKSMDCEGADSGQAVCKIAKAEQETRQQQGPT